MNTLTTRIALRYLFSRKSHAAVNIISYVAMAAIAVAAAAMVIVLSVFNGFAAFTYDRLSGLDPDLTVLPASGKAIAAADSLARVIGDIEGVAMARPQVDEHAFAVAGQQQMAVRLRGVTDDSRLRSTLTAMTIDGTAYTPAEVYGFTPAMGSVGVAMGLRAMPANPVYIKLYEPRRRGRLNPSNPMQAMRTDSVIVTAVYRAESDDYDRNTIVVPIELARRLLQYTDEATTIEVTLAEGADAQRVAAAIEAVGGGTVKVSDRLQMQAHAMRMIAVEKWVTLLMLVFILVIACFNILSTMSMLIIDKQPNRAILLAMGATRRTIAAIFARLSLLITAIGGAAGIVVGLVLSLVQQCFGLIRLSGGEGAAMAIDTYPVRVAVSDTLIVAGIIAAAALLSAAAVAGLLRRR